MKWYLVYMRGDGYGKKYGLLQAINEPVALRQAEGLKNVVAEGGREVFVDKVAQVTVAQAAVLNFLEIAVRMEGQP